MRKILFGVISKLGVHIRTTKSHWELISEVKHPEIKGRETEVQNCLADPDEVRISQDDEDVYLYYSRWRQKYFICVVARPLNKSGFIVTCYVTKRIQEGTLVWTKS